MKKLVVLMVATMLASVVIAGCSAAPADKIYGKQDTNITVNKGGAFTIQLEENPTTGYGWTVSISDDSVVKLSNDKYTSDTTDENIVGAGGTHAYTFESLSKGTAQITFAYERSFEDDSAVETVVYNITIN